MKKDKKEEGKKYKFKNKKGLSFFGLIKGFFLLILLVIVVYCGLHIFFMGQPAGAPTSFSKLAMDLEVSGQKVFPVVQPYDSAKIAGRDIIQKGDPIERPVIPERLESAIKQGYPVTFREEEVNIWLNQRLKIEQEGLMSSRIEAKNIWVDFKKDEIELIIERDVFGISPHMTSLFMHFEKTDNGFTISRDSSHMGQVKVPGGFARLIMPAFNNLLEELSEEMKLYQSEGGKARIFDVKVEDGQITLDPTRPVSKG